MIVLVKVLLAPALVVASSLAGRRWGARVSGVLVALPLVAGPILAIIAVQQGPVFGARAAASALLGLVTLVLFAVTVASVCRRTGWAASLLLGWVVCLLADAVAAAVPVPLPAALAAAIAAAVAGERWLAGAGRRLSPGGGRDPVTRLPWWDLPARAAATAVLVMTVTGAAAAAGPRLSGVLAPFPVATSVVTGFALAQDGPAGAVALLRGLCEGLAGFAAFCFLVAVLGPRLGVVVTFAVATAATIALQGTLHAVRARWPSAVPHVREPGAVSGRGRLPPATRSRWRR